MKKIILLLIFFTSFSQIQAQSIVQGTIKNIATGEPLVGAFISLKGTKLAAVSELNGSYQIIIPSVSKPEKYFVSVNHLGFYDGLTILELLPIDDGETLIRDFELEEDPLTMKDVVVTANRVEEELQSVPIAVTALTSIDLQKQNIASTDEAFQNIPNVITDAYLPSQSTFSIRGLASDIFNGPGFENAVGFYIDDVYYSKSYHFNQLLMDIERVEALRGPQGTLFGKNTVGGVLHVISEDPKMDDFGSVELTAGNFRLLQARGKGNIMLVKDKVALRLAGAYRQRDGWLVDENSATDDTNKSLFYGGRASLLIQPSKKLKITLRGAYGQDDKAEQTTNYFPSDNELNLLNVPEEEFDPEDRRVNTSHDDAFFERSTYSSLARIEIKPDKVHTITSITAINGSDGAFSQDFDGSSADGIVSYRATKIDAFSQEIRVGTPRENRKFFYTGGLFFLTEKIFNEDRLTYGSDLFPSIAYNSGDPSLIELIDVIDDYAEEGRSFADMKTKNYAAYLSTSYEISERVRLNGGIRITREEKDLTYYQTVEGYPLFASPFVAVSIPEETAIERTVSNDAISWNVGMDFQTTDKALIYLNVSRGFKGAGFNTILVDENSIDRAGFTFQPEYIFNYELGLKIRANNRYQFNTAVFVTDFKNKQEALFIDNQVLIENAKAVQGQGVEAEFIGIWSDNFKTDVSLGALNLKYVDFPITLPDGTEMNLSGNRSYKAPNLTFKFAPEYHCSIGKELKLMVRGDYNYIGKAYNDIFNTEAIARRGVGILNGRISFSTKNEKYAISIWGKNLTEEVYFQHGWLAETGNQAAINPPRTIGMELRINFY